MLERLIEIAREAGAEILRHYQSCETVTMKDGRFPLTVADQAAHRLIQKSLSGLTPNLPVLSEESDPEEIRGRDQWGDYWLVDPLDGTKEFLKRSGEFTVNIALIRGLQAIAGVIYAPVLDRVYYAHRDQGAFCQQGDQAARQIFVRRSDPARLCVVVSKDHAGPQVEEMLELIPNAQRTSMGSSLKFCLVAEGKADMYPRMVPTMEWDTAAAQCLVEVAGGQVLTLDGRPLCYRKAVLENPSIICLGDQAIPWRDYLALGQPKTQGV